MIVHRLHEIPGGDRRLRDKCHHLRQGVHSRVRPPRALRQYLFPRNPSNDRGKCALHGRGVGLHLPAGEFRPVIGESHFEIAHPAIFRVPRYPCIIQRISGFASNLPVPRAMRCESSRVPVSYTVWFPEFRSHDGDLLLQRLGKPPEPKARDGNETGAAAGEGLFLPAFRNLPPLLCVPMPE